MLIDVSTTCAEVIIRAKLVALCQYMVFTYSVYVPIVLKSVMIG